MKKTKQFLLMALTICVILSLNTSCGDKGKSKKLLPSKITLSFHEDLETYTGSYVISYDGDKRITQIAFDDDGILYATGTYSYNPAGQLTKQEMAFAAYPEDNYAMNYTYSGDTVLVSGSETGSFYRPDIKYVLDKNGRPVKIYEVDEGEELLLYTCTYDSKGNLVKAVDPMGEEMTLNYDAKNGVFSKINMPTWFFVFEGAFAIDDLGLSFNHVNNAMKLTVLYDGDPYGTEEYAITYKDDYPSKIMATSTWEDEPVKGKKATHFSRNPFQKRNAPKSGNDTYTYQIDIEYIEK